MHTIIQLEVTRIIMHVYKNNYLPEIWRFVFYFLLFSIRKMFFAMNFNRFKEINIVTLIIFSHMWKFSPCFQIEKVLKTMTTKRDFRVESKKRKAAAFLQLVKKEVSFDNLLTTRVFDGLIFHPSVIDKTHLRHLSKRINQFQITLMFHFKTLYCTITR